MKLRPNTFDWGRSCGVVIGTLCLCIVAATAASAAQTQCRFEIQTSDQGSFAVNLPVHIIAQGPTASVSVSGSGTYQAQTRQLSGKGSEHSFVTPVSREVITVGDGGETLWHIDFTDGRTMAYIGHCVAER